MPRAPKASLVKIGSAKAKELLKSVEELDPKISAELSQEAGFDVEKAFQTYAQFSGDVVRTGHALGVPAVDILRAADRLGWNKQLESILALKSSGKPGDVERGISRALNFIQAHRMRIVLERLLDILYAKSAEELFDMALTTKTTKGKGGVETETVSLNTRPFADICAALEKVQSLTYLALADSVGERTKRSEEREDGVSATQLHSMIASAMAKAAPAGDPSTQLLQQQLDEAKPQDSVD